jgi:hypothetical protein
MRLSGFADDMRQGRQLRVPFCCRLRYALEAATRYDPEQALTRGIRFNQHGIEYVPCGLFHQATLTHREHEHRLNIRQLQCRS